MFKVALITLAALFFTVPSYAQESGMPSNSHWAGSTSKSKTVYKTNRRAQRDVVRTNIRTASLSPSQLIPHPAGCPRRLFCGCGASMKLFGTVKPGLMLAANWLKFPRATPGPGMVAANRRHVFVIDKVLGNGTVMAYDYNSGGGQSRYHARSLAGYTVVSPRG